MKPRSLPRIVREEWFLGVGIVTAVIFEARGGSLFDTLANPFGMTALFAWLFAVIMGSALSVVRHADHLAVRLGEPYGTLILTLSVASIEVISITTMMLHGANNPTLVRDT